VVNLVEVMRCTKAVLPQMRAAGKGHVVAKSSAGAYWASRLIKFYCTTKFAVERHIESLATYLGPAFGLHFSAIKTRSIVSEFASNVMKNLLSARGILEDGYKPIVEKCMAGEQARGLSALQTSDAVAQVVMDCIQADQPPVHISLGRRAL
jgi:short-subunit dehydrogenase